MQSDDESDTAAERRGPFWTPTDEELDEGELDEIDPDDPRWDALIPDEDERDPQPEYGDFWPAG